MQKGGSIAFAIALIFGVVIYAVTNRFAAPDQNLVGSSDVITFATAIPGVNDDITLGFLPGYVWVNLGGQSAFIATDTTDGVANWIDITAVGTDGVGYDEVLDEAVGLTKRLQLNFEGAGINCVDNGGATRTDCTIAGGAANTVDIEEDNILEQADAEVIDFQTGFNVTCVASECDVFVNLGDDIVTGEIVDDEILEVDLDVTNGPTDNFILSSDTGSGGFTWIDPAGIADGFGYDEIMDEGSGLTKRAQLNFIGAGVSCVDNGGATRTDCTIAGGAANTVDIEEDNISEQVDAEVIDFGVGFDVVCAASECDITVNLGDDIVTGEIVDDTILEIDLDITNGPTDNFFLTSDTGSGGFTWVTNPNTNDGVGYDEVFDEGSGLTKRAVLNFLGSIITCVDNASRTECTITDHDGFGYDEIMDEASGLTKRAQVNFIGAGVSCVDNGGATRTDCTIAGGAANTVDIEEDNILEQTDAEVIDFGLGFNVSCSASECDVTVNLGDDIVTGEIVDDTILEVDLDSVNSPTDELCLTFETDNSGFEWQSCGASDGFGYDEVLEEASGLPKQAQINFIGGTITCVDNPGATRTDCTITAHDGVGIDEVLEEGAGLTKRDQINFIGGIITCVDNGGATRTDCTLTAHDGFGYDEVLDEGAGLTKRAQINFIGSGVVCVDNASRTECTIAGGAANTVDIEEDNSLEQTDAEVIDFGVGFDVVCAASECDITVNLGDDIVTGEIVDDTILEIDLDVTNEPTDNFVLTSDTGTGAFSWVDPVDIADGVGYDEILDQGTNLTKRAQVNFVGTPITCVDNPGLTRTDCTISVHDGFGYDEVMDEGAGLTKRAQINFIGAGVVCVDNASRTECTIAGGAANTVDIEEDNSLEQTDAEVIDFGVGFDVVCAASECDITVNLGDDIVTGEIVDDTILPIDLDAVDTENDEECVTFETTGAVFEFQDCLGDLVAGTNIVKSGDTLNVPGSTFAITIENPSATEDIGIWNSELAITITREECVLNGSATPSVTITLRHGTDRNATGAELNTSGNSITSTTTGDEDVAFNDATIIADSWIWIETTAQSGTVTLINCVWDYNFD